MSRRGHDRGDRHDPAAERLAEQVHVGPHPVVLAGEGGAGPAQPGLDLIGDHERAVRRAQVPDGGQVTRRRHHDAGLALDRLDQDAHHVGVHRRGQRGGVPVGHDAEPGGVRPERGAGVGVGGEADDRRGPAVEIAVERHDDRLVSGHALDLVAPLAGGLDRRFHRLRAGVHRQHHLHARELRELGAEQAELVMVEGPADQGHPVQLPLRGSDQGRVAVAEVQRGVRREHVQVPAAAGIGDPGPLGLGDHDGQRVIVVRAVRLGQGAQVLRSHGHGVSPSHGRSSSVQHFGPPPALRNSDMSTGTGSNPRAESWAASAMAWAGRTT